MNDSVYRFTLENIEAAAAWLLQNLPESRVFALNGPMGAGKTTFVAALSRILGVTGHPSSPTFALIHQYLTASGQTVYHADLYRLSDENEAMSAGVEDILYSGQYCFVEWPEKAPGLFPPGTVYLQIEILSPVERALHVTGNTAGRAD